MTDPAGPVGMDPAELQHILNSSEYSVSHPSPYVTVLESSGPPRSSVVIQTSAVMRLPDSRFQCRLPQECIPELLNSVKQSQGQTGGGDS